MKKERSVYSSVTGGMGVNKGARYGLLEFSGYVAFMSADCGYYGEVIVRVGDAFYWPLLSSRGGCCREMAVSRGSLYQRCGLCSRVPSFIFLFPLVPGNFMALFPCSLAETPRGASDIKRNGLIIFSINSKQRTPQWYSLYCCFFTTISLV